MIRETNEDTGFDKHYKTCGEPENLDGNKLIQVDLLVEIIL